MSKTILFFGTEDFSLITLQALVEAGFSIGAVITKPDARRGRSKANTEPKVKTFAKAHNIPVWQPNNLNEIADDIAALHQPIGVLVSYGKILPQSIIDLFTPGIINVHPSLLPSYRGPTPIESAIIHGDDVTGVSIMQLTARMDAGPIYSQTTHPLTGSETKPELYAALGQEGASELVRVLPQIMAGELLPTPQRDENASYCPLLSKQDTLVNPTDYTATEIERRIRAHLGFPKTRLPFMGDTPIILAAHVTDTATPATITCRNNTLLAIDTLVAPSGKAMPVEAYLHGRRA